MLSLIRALPGNGSRRPVCVLALTVTLAFGANAQTPASQELHIELTGALCNKDVQQVWVVSNGEDERRKAIEDIENNKESKSARTDDLKCNWKLRIEWQNFNISYFSLRLGTGRTRCRHAKVDGSYIHLEFGKIGTGTHDKSTRNPVTHDLAIDGTHVIYARELSATPDGDVQCWEKGGVPASLSDVQLDIEHLRVRLSEQKPVACGVTLDDVVNFDKARIGELVPVTTKELARLVAKQGLQAKNCYAPTDTPVEALEPGLHKAHFDIKVTR